MKKMVLIFLVVLLAVTLQGLWCFLIYKTRECMRFVAPIIAKVLSVLFVLFVVTRSQKEIYNFFWTFMILILPIFGTVLYVFFANKNVPNYAQEHNTLETDNDMLNELKNSDSNLYNTLKNISKKCDLPIVYNKKSKYFKSGKEMFEDMIKELESAKKSIYLQYFSIEDGYFWSKLFEILKKKLEENVDIRIISDNYKSNKNSIKKLRNSGIKYASFNPLTFKNGILNNRGHRKMMIIDNNIAYSGGINIADEYINKIEKYGHYKDIGFKLEGAGVENYLTMFVDFWNRFSKEKIDKKKHVVNFQNKNYNNGFVLSYYDIPTLQCQNSYNLYIDLLYNAKKYVWFYTPYLILTEEFINSLIKCAQRGVDVRIITPDIPDKKIIKKLTASYYNELINGGVKIHEFKDGFIHGKACVMDDRVCTIGSVNLDYRSLFLDYENNSIFVNSDIVYTIKEDFENTFIETKKMNYEKKSFLNKVIESILKIYSPLC